MRQAGATLHRGARASHYRGLSCCGAQAPDTQAQQLWLMGLVAPRHVGSSQTRARTRVPCIGRQTLNHCVTSEAPIFSFLRNLHTVLHSGCYQFTFPPTVPEVSLFSTPSPAFIVCRFSVDSGEMIPHCSLGLHFSNN